MTKKCSQELQHAYTAIVMPVNFSLQRCSRCRCRRGFLISPSERSCRSWYTEEQSSASYHYLFATQSRDLDSVFVTPKSITCIAIGFLCVVFYLDLSYRLFYSTPDLVKYYLHVRKTVNQ